MNSEVLVERLRSPLAQSRALRPERRTSMALALAGALVVGWLLADPQSPDLAAQVYRVKLFESSGMTVWDNAWYAGHHMLGYSLVFPWLAGLLGMRLVGALSVVVSTWAFERLVVPVYGPGARWAASCFALSAAGDLWIGRLTFALGVTFAVLAVLSLARERAWLAFGLACACAATSPVAGLLLALAAATYVLAERRWRAGLVLGAPCVAIVGCMQLLFPEGGWEPFAASSVFAALGVTAAFVFALPRAERMLRIGGLVYGAVVLLSLIHAPMGGNIDRYGVLLAGPMLLAGVSRSGWRGPGRPLAVVGLTVCAILVWTVWGPLRESQGVAGDPSTTAAYYVPLERFLAAHGGVTARVEVPFTYSHWEAALLAPNVSLARGWERQLDTKYDGLFFGGTLTPARYRAWLEREAVWYVALPDVRLDTSATSEAALIRGGLPYLKEVLHTRHWRVFAVVKPTPLASAPARIEAVGHEWFTLRFARPGTSLVRLRYTSYWTPTAAGSTVAGGSMATNTSTVGACVTRGPEGWTLVSATAAATVRVAARFSLVRALAPGSDQCLGAKP